MCLTPITIKNKRTDENLSVPCGRCPLCYARRVSGWSFRLMEEDKVSTSSYFLTLTYDTDTVPITKHGFMGLSKRHVQLFFKRLRKSHDLPAEARNRVSNETGKPIKYFAVGEYGGKKFRPHYHIILFNVELELMMDPNDKMLLEYTDFDGKQPVKLHSWDHGHATFGKVNGASVGYTLKYMCKPSRIPLHANDDRQPEFSLMSKSWGPHTSLMQ